MPENKAEFIAVHIAVMTVSDSRTHATDKSGAVLAERITKAGHHLADRCIVGDDADEIEAKLKEWIADPLVDVVISTGGTGVTGRDVTPEAMGRVFDKRIEGFGEMFRWISFAKIGTSALQSRAVGGVARGTYIFGLPGSPSACIDGWDEILESQLDIRHKPCNFVELMPRLMEQKSGG